MGKDKKLSLSLDNHELVRANQSGNCATIFYACSTSRQLGAGQLASVDGPLTNDTITYTYDVLGRVKSRAIDGVAQAVTYDALGRVSELYTPTKAALMPPVFALAPRLGYERFSNEAKFAYIKLNTQMPCPPRSTVPVNAGRTWEILSLYSFRSERR